MANALNAIRDVKIALMMSTMDRISAEHTGQQHHNVTDLAAYRKKCLH